MIWFHQCILVSSFKRHVVFKNFEIEQRVIECNESLAGNEILFYHVDWKNGCGC